MLAAGININDKSLIGGIFGGRTADEQLNKTCKLVFQLASVPG